MFSEKKYGDAAKIYDELKDFEDAGDKSNECYYLMAQAMYDEEKFSEAEESFSKVGTYKNAREMVENCQYQQSVDGQFMRALARGLQKRWDYADTDESDMLAKDMIAYRRKLIDYELNEISEYEGKAFNNKKLGKLGGKYIDILKLSNKALDYYMTDYTQFTFKWNELYAKRSQYIRDFTEKYNLTVDEKYQDTLNEFINTAGAADESDKLKKQVDELVANISVERVANEWGQYTVYVTMTNTTEYIFDYFYVTVNFMDSNGTVVGSTNSNMIQQFEKGQTARIETYFYDDFVTASYVPHYQSGTYYQQ